MSSNERDAGHLAAGGLADIGMGKIAALEEERLAERFCRRISETIAKIQLCGMTAASADACIAGPGLKATTAAVFVDEFNARASIDGAQ